MNSVKEIIQMKYGAEKYVMEQDYETRVVILLNMDGFFPAKWRISFTTVSISVYLGVNNDALYANVLFTSGAQYATGHSKQK